MFFMSETHTPHYLCQKKPQKPRTKYKGDFKLFDYSIIISSLLFYDATCLFNWQQSFSIFIES